MASSPAAEGTWKLHGPISDSYGATTSSSCENPLDWTCEEELKGRATALFFPLKEGEILVQEGDVVVIREQTLGGEYFVIHNKRSGQKGKVPVDYIEIIPEDVDEVPLPVIKPTPPPIRPGHSLHRQLGVSRRKGIEVRQRMSATLPIIDPPEVNGDHPSSSSSSPSTPSSSSSSTLQSSTFPRLAKPLTTTAPSTAQSLAVLSTTTSTKDTRAATLMAVTDQSGTGDVRKDSRSATVAIATGGASGGQVDDDVVEYEPGFQLVEKYNIVSVSGSDRDGRPVIVISACRLPPSYAINHDTLLRYGKYVLDKIVEQDYTLLYCHYGLRSTNKPSFSWLRKVYAEMDRKYKKNIKKMYILHPTNFIRVMMSLMKPFINMKFGKKVSYVNRLAELEDVLYLDSLDIPDEVKQHDFALKAPIRSPLVSSGSVFHVPLPSQQDQEEAAHLVSTNATAATIPTSTRQFGVHLEKVTLEENGIPMVLTTCVHLLEKKGLQVVGIFRRSPATATIKTFKEQFNQGHVVDLESHGDPHLAAVLIKLFLRELPEPLLTFDLYNPILELKSQPAVEEKVTVVRKMLKESLPPVNYAILQYLIRFLARVAENEEQNKMSSSNISIVIGPNLIWGKNPSAILRDLPDINNFTLLLLNHSGEIFPVDDGGDSGGQQTLLSISPLESS